jgi:hypothetical protein
VKRRSTDVLAVLTGAVVGALFAFWFIGATLAR